jgi:hypothetical protein
MLSSRREVLMETAVVKSLSLLVLFLISVSSENAMSNFAYPSADDKPAVIVGAGDIADCSDISGAEATAKLIEQT